MEKEFPFVHVPDHLREIVGEPDKGTRLYRVYASEEFTSVWFDALCEICHGPGMVSPGGVSMYAKVSREAVHKRLKSGKLTGFLFHVVTDSMLSKIVGGNIKSLKFSGRPYCYIPTSECKAWALELESRGREPLGPGEGSDNFMKAPWGWRKKVVKEEEHCDRQKIDSELL